MMVLVSGGEGGGGGGDSGDSGVLVAPNAVEILSEMKAVGGDMIADVQYS